METYIIKGNHPTFKYVNLIANGESDLRNKMHELLTNGYEVTIELQTTKQTNTISSMEDIFDRMHKLLADGYKVIIELQTTKCPDTTLSMGDVLRSAVKNT